VVATGGRTGRADAPLIGGARPPDLHVMTYNIRRRLPHVNPRSPDAWSDRRHLLRRTLATERPTVLGVQEALLDQALLIAEALGPSYRWVGRGRNADGRGEHCPLYYDTTRLALVSWRQLALSATPEVAGSRTWGNGVPRIAVLARFSDRATGLPLTVVNFHFDHLSRRSRVESARLVRELAAEAAGPVVVLGDANAGVGTLPFREIAGTATLLDAWSIATERLTPPWGTFSHYRAPRPGGKRIDWMLVSRDIEVRAVGVNTVRYDGSAASDHDPVQSLLRIREGAASPSRVLE
jgi:endonuclease/exonuclease/phosphatase family metal-dependent hydrolase